jgi:hypothetical protein
MIINCSYTIIIVIMIHTNAKKVFSILFLFVFLITTKTLHANALTLTSGNNATTTPNVATAITGFQIVGNAASTTPVKLFSTSGTLSMTATSGLTFTGSQTGSVIYFSGTVADINNALSTLRYSRASTGTDTLEVSLVPFGEAFFTTNGHLYKFISGSINWNDAFTAAQTQTAYGASGYLATITSSAENAFVSGRLTGDGWIGGADTAVEGVWRWMSGPETGINFWNGTGGGSSPTYASWAGSEPNQSGNEDCAQTYVASGNWNDLPCTATVAGYVVEFGTDGNLPAVVATNISVVTADVPAVTSLSPTNGSVLATANQNLIIGFSKSVNADSGNILIKKVSDDSLIESIVATSTQITGGGTNTITINPNTTLTEGVQYYVTIPGTAFRDGSNNFFNGISGSSTWAFTILDQTSPIITNLSATSSTSTAVITWDTNEPASTKAAYSVDISYTSSSTVQATYTNRVTSHTAPITGLAPCTTYNYRGISYDAAGNLTQTPSNATIFTTTGCAAPTLSATTTTTFTYSTSTTELEEDGKSIVVITPPNVTSTSSTIVIQIKSLDSQTVFSSTSKPTNMSTASNIVFDVTALIDDTTVLDSFDVPVTISQTYTDEEIVGLDENSLWMYHFHRGAWIRLSTCNLNTVTNTITCTTPSFSIFGIFGVPPVVSTNTTTTMISGGGSTAFGCKDPKATNYEYFVSNDPSKCVYGNKSATPPSSSNILFTRTLKIGSKGDDVKRLQEFLNTKGFSIAKAGAGSAGNETTMFGAKTAEAVKKFQEAHKDTILIPSKLKAGTGVFGMMSIKYVNTLLVK